MTLSVLQLVDTVACVFLTFATCSSHRPKEMNTNSIGGVSKKVTGFTFAFSAIATRRTTSEYTKAMVVASTMSTSMFAVLCFTAL